jgi:hypothetical protein
MLFKIPAMHPTRTTNRNERSTTYYTISDRMPHPRSTTPQTQTVTEQKETRSRGAASSRKTKGQREQRSSTGVYAGSHFFFYGDDLIRSTRTAKERNATQRAQEHRYRYNSTPVTRTPSSGREVAAADTTAHRPRDTDSTTHCLHRATSCSISSRWMVPLHPPDKFKRASPRKSMGHIGFLSGVRCSRNAGKAALHGGNGSLDADIARRTRKLWFKVARLRVQAPPIKATIGGPGTIGEVS